MTLDVKSALVGVVGGIVLAAAVGGTPLVIELAGMKVRLNGAEQEKLGALIRADAVKANAALFVEAETP